MKILVAHDVRVFAELAFNEITGVVKEKPNAVLGLATGSTPLRLYGKMVDDHVRNGTDYGKVTTFNLDEYVGLGEEDEQSYVSFMRKNLFDGIELPYSRTNFLDGLALNLGRECERYAALIREYEVDVQLLGIGGNGHIAFNEPGTPFDSTTHPVTLAQNTVFDNARFFSSLAETPTRALTMGLSDIMRAKKIVLIADGKRKADAVYRMVKGAISPECPASILRNHPNCMVILDDAAASKLTGVKDEEDDD